MSSELENLSSVMINECADGEIYRLSPEVEPLQLLIRINYVVVRT